MTNAGLIPVMDFQTLLDLREDVGDSFGEISGKGAKPPTMTSIGASSQLVVVGMSDGSVRAIESDARPATYLQAIGPRLHSPITAVSVDATCFCYLAGESGELVVSNRSTFSTLQVDPIHLPALCVAISPDYALAKRIVVGGATGDLLVLSQQGVPFPPVSVSRTHSAGPITSIAWRTEFLVWTGPEFGTKIINTSSGDRLCHLKSTGLVAAQFLTDDLVLVHNKFTVTLIRLKGGYCEVVRSIGFPPAEYSLSLSGVMGALQEMVDCGKKRILGFGLFDETELSLTMVTSQANSLTHHIIDTNCRDIPVADEFITDSASSCTVSFLFVPGQSAYSLASCGSRLVRIGKRSVGDHCMWLIDAGQFEEALDFAKISSPAMHAYVAHKALVPLIDSNSFQRAVSLVSHLDLTDKSSWSNFLNHFVSLPTGPALAQSLQSLVSVLPFPPKHDLVLDKADYDKVVNSFLRNIQFSAHDLLETVRRWPRGVYSSSVLQDSLIDVIPEDFVLDQSAKSELLAGGVLGYPSSVPAGLLESEAARTISLMLTLRILFEGSNRLEDALDILLRLRCCGEIFSILKTSLITAPSTKEWACINLLSLFQTEPRETAKFILSEPLHFPIQIVTDELEQHPFLLHVYLRELFFLSPQATREWHDQQVGMFLEFDKDLLPRFLREADGYDVGASLDKVRRVRKGGEKRLVEAEALLRWKAGESMAAIELLLDVSKDIETAVRFASAVNDAGIWDTIAHRVKLNENELTPGFLKALLASKVPSTLIKPDRILLNMSSGVRSPDLLSLSSKVLEAEALAAQIDACSLSLLMRDYIGKRGGFGNHQGIVHIDPVFTLCRICGSRICAPPPGDSLRDDELLETISSAAGCRYTRVGSALALLDSGGSSSHCKCLLRTAVESIG